MARTEMMGSKFGRLTVIDLASRPVKAKELYWLCRCDCGKTHASRGTHLRNGNVTSCGCLAREATSARMTGKPALNKTHGEKGSPEHTCWSSMNTRCSNTAGKSYPRYGGRGISVCARWSGKDGYINFLNDMGRRPSSLHSIERINNDEGYSPTNCKWATRVEQATNRRTTKFITINGETFSMGEWERVRGLPKATVHQRINKLGWNETDAVLRPMRGSLK